MSVSIIAMSMYTVYDFPREEHVLKKDTIIIKQKRQINAIMR